MKDLSSTSTQEISLSASDRSDNDATISEENKTLRELIETKESEIKALRATVDILENKVSNAETNLLKHFKETKNIEISYKKEKEESTLLKDVVKNHHGEISKIRAEMKGHNKAQKSSEKEIYNLVNKTDNQQEVIKRLREENSCLKRDQIKKEKEFKKLLANTTKDKNQNISPLKPLKVDATTNTEGVNFSSSMHSSTVCSASPLTLPTMEILSKPSLLTSVASSTSTTLNRLIVSTCKDLPNRCLHSPQCTLRHPNTPPPFAPITFEQFYHHEKPPKQIFLLPCRRLSFIEFRELESKGEHECEECEPGMLFNEYTERVEYCNPGPCGGTMAQYLRACPNSPRATISVTGLEIETKIKNIKTQYFRCEICAKVFEKFGTLSFHTSRMHGRK